MARRPTLDKSIADLIERFGPIIADAFFTSFNDIRENVILKAVIDAIEQGDIIAAFEAMGFSDAAMRPITRAIEAAFESGGIATASSFPRLGTNKAVFRFDVRNSRAEKWLREYSSTLITEITEGQKLAVRNLIEIGVRDGRNPRNIGLDIVGRVDPATGRRVGGVVGLTSGQAQAVARARAELSDPATAGQYLNRARRDMRFDSVVRRSIDTGVPLDADTVSRLSGKYADSLLQLRGETIGRTEALQSLNQSREQAFNQAVDEGLISKSAVTRAWDSAGDRRTRHSHAAMDGQTVGLDEPFVSPSGARLMFPGDRTLGAPAEEIINCRCVVRHEVDFLAGVEGEPEKPTLPTRPMPDDKEIAKRVVEKGKKTGREYLEGYDQNTNQTFTQTGEASSVGFTKELEDALDDPTNRLVLHHNHPNSSGFSSADINVLATSPGLDQFYAHGHNGSSFKIARDLKELTSKIVTQVTATVNEALKPLVRSGQLSAKDAALIQSNAVPLALQRAGVLRYDPNPQGDTARILAKYQNVSEQLANQIAALLR